MTAGRETTWAVVPDLCSATQKLERGRRLPKFRVTDTGIVNVDEAASGAHAREDAKLSFLDVCRLSHSRLQLDHLAIHSEPTVSVMVDGLRSFCAGSIQALSTSGTKRLYLLTRRVALSLQRLHFPTLSNIPDWDITSCRLRVSKLVNRTSWTKRRRILWSFASRVM